MVRIASFNVENLFARPNAFRSTDLSVAEPVLAAYAEVNELITTFHPDYALFRRYLVDHGFMTREDNLYWRSGGTFEV